MAWIAFSLALAVAFYEVERARSNQSERWYAVVWIGIALAAFLLAAARTINALS